MSVQEMFRITNAMHKRARTAVESMVEHGGNIKVNFKAGTLHEGQTTKSTQYAGIQFSRSLVEWHSHPGNCTETECAISLPSPRDVINVLSGACYGVQAHLVYSKEGAYVIQVGPVLKQRAMAALPCSLRQEACKVAKALNALHKSFMDSAIKYSEYKSRWMTLTRKLGFETRLVPKGQHPEIKLDLSPDDLANGKTEARPVAIKDAPEQPFKNNKYEKECPLCDDLKEL